MVSLTTGQLALLSLESGDGVMMALLFDGQSLEVLGNPVPVVDGVRREETHGFGHLAVARDGTLVYGPGVNAHWGYLGTMDTAGAADTLKFPQDQYDWLALSPDGTKLLAARRPEEGGATAIYLLDLNSEQSRRLSIDEDLSISAWLWSDNDRFLLHRPDPVIQALFGSSEYSLSEASVRYPTSGFRKPPPPTGVGMPSRRRARSSSPRSHIPSSPIWLRKARRSDPAGLRAATHSSSGVPESSGKSPSKKTVGFESANRSGSPRAHTSVCGPGPMP